MADTSVGYKCPNCEAPLSFQPGQDKVTYVHMSPEKAARVVAEHIVNNKPVAEYTIGATE